MEGEREAVGRGTEKEDRQLSSLESWGKFWAQRQFADHFLLEWRQIFPPFVLVEEFLPKVRDVGESILYCCHSPSGQNSSSWK